jgi:hypothetical protein
MQPLSGEDKIERLKKALARENYHTWEDVVAKCREGVFQLLDSPQAACVTHLVKRTDGRVTCTIVALGGTMGGVRSMVGIVEDFARAHGCASVTWSGRRGWDRVYAGMSTGYRPVAIMYEKDLTDAHE